MTPPRKVASIEEVMAAADRMTFHDKINGTGEHEFSPAESVGESQVGPSWPELDDAALHGLAGDIVNTIAPFTEADKVTLLVHILSEFSCMIGRGPHIKVDGDDCPLSFWPVVVGDTSKSRKGSGGKRIKRLFQSVDSEWTRGKHSGSPSSGEGLIYAVRDEEWEINKKGENVLRDDGIQDKRLYLVLPEFGVTLRIMGREGNSLSGIFREAWDGETLRPMTKGHRICATHPHIVFAAHVTQAELLRNLDSTEMANGFGNRLVWFCVRRSQFLPFAEDPPAAAMNPFIARLRDVLHSAKVISEIGMTKAARTWWCEGYQELSQGTPGLAGSLLDRAEAQVRRIAALYALLDQKKDVDDQHLLAALALWKYSEASVRHIFGDKIGDYVADTILAALLRSSDGLSDTEISCLFNRHESATRLGQAKTYLQDRGLIESSSRSTGGRPTLSWVAKKAKEAN